MRIFLTWSGNASKQLAHALRGWLKRVIQSTDPWMSETDIASGAPWDDQMTERLRSSAAGLVCLTPENLTAPWVHFEAGALSNAVEHSTIFVCPYLLRLRPSDIVGPLRRFQARQANREGTWQILETLNKHSKLQNPLAPSELKEVFDMWWPKLESEIDAINVEAKAIPPQRSMEDIGAEILEMVKGVSREQGDLLNVSRAILAKHSLSVPIGRATIADPIQPFVFTTVCGKCGTANPGSSIRCVSCGADFPTIEL